MVGFKMPEVPKKTFEAVVGGRLASAMRTDDGTHDP